MRATRTRHAQLLVVAVGLVFPALAGAQDLVASITAITVQNTQVSYTLRVCNQGTVSASSQLALYYDLSAAPTCSTTPSATWNATNLASGECRSFNHSRSNVPLGTYTAWARADYNCQVSESNETNNNASQAYSVLAELVALNVTAAISGTTVTYTATVRNTGATIGTSFSVGLYYNRATTPTCGDAPSYTWTVSGLAHNATTTLQHVRTGAPTGAFLAWAFVDSGCAVTEPLETNNTTSREYGVGIDLRLSAPTVSSSGSTVTYSIYVCNMGTVASGAFSVSLWYDRTSTPVCGTTGADHTWSVSSLAAWTGDPLVSCTTLTHVRTGAAAGTYTAWFFADPTCAITESDESDNIRSRTYSVIGPDFYFSSFTATVSGTQVTYSATVCNQGAATTASILVGLYYNRATAPGCNATADHTWTVSAGLAAGGCTTLSHVRTGVSAGSYTAWAFADRTCAIAESDETNNTSSVPYSISPTQPDLYVATLTTVVSGSTVTYTALVCNAGSSTSTGFSVGFYYNRTTAPTCAASPDATVTQSGGLLAGLCATLTYVRTGATQGSYTAWALADQGCAVTESSETNNATSDNYTVSPANQPDLQVDSLTVTVSGTTVTFMATVCNKGNAGAASSTVGLFYHRSAAPSTLCLDSPDATATVNTLSAGACETKTWTLTNAAPGSYTAWAMADVTCTVSESSESNNSTSKAYSVASVVPDSGAPDLPPLPDSVAWPDGGPKADGVAKQDTGLKSDGAKADGAPLVDGAPAGDGPAKADGRVDRGPVADGSSADGPPAAGDSAQTDGRTDGGVGGEPASPSTDDGCDCALGRAAPESGASLLLLALLGLALWRRRRP